MGVSLHRGAADLNEPRNLSLGGGHRQVARNDAVGGSQRALVSTGSIGEPGRVDDTVRSLQLVREACDVIAQTLKYIAGICGAGG